MKRPDARTRRVAEIQRLAAERGIKIERQGQAWRLTGPGVSILAADLSNLSPVDLAPARRTES